MNDDNLISAVVGVMFLIIVTVVFIRLPIVPTVVRGDMLNECYNSNFENITLHGSFSGEFDCKQYYQNFYANGKWTEICSDWFFSNKLSCNYLCNIDCAYQSKLAGAPVCVC